MAEPYPRLSFVSDQYDAVYKESINNPRQFWGKLGKRRLEWSQPFDQVMKCDLKTGEFKWFLDGKINVSGIYIIVYV